MTRTASSTTTQARSRSQHLYDPWPDVSKKVTRMRAIAVRRSVSINVSRIMLYEGLSDMHMVFHTEDIGIVLSRKQIDETC